MQEKKAQLIAMIGEAGVIEDPGIGESFLLDHDSILPMKPHFLVRPGNVEDVQNIVRWANQTLTPLVPVSSGGPHLRGDSLPTAPESVIVDLSGMKQILKVDRRNRLALIQPGVTYSQLQPELQKEGLRVVAPLLPRANKSVIASLLEREPVMSPKYQWNLLEPLRSLEVVWGNGDKFYSGSGVFRGEKEADWQEGRVPLQGPGPGQLDFYKFVSAAQGSMGIVTWASVKCEVYPESRRLSFIPAEKLDDLIDFTYQLLKFRFGDELFILNNTGLAYVLGDTAQEIESLKNVLPAWAVIVGITGGQILAREKIIAQENDIQDTARQFELKLMSEIRGCHSAELLEILLRPSREPYWKLRYKGGSQEIFFLTTLDRTPGCVNTMFTAANRHKYPAEDIGIYLQPVHQGVGCHCEFILPFCRTNGHETGRLQDLFSHATLSLFRQGAYFSRPYGMWADMVYNADAGTLMAMQKVKDIFDPNHVMNPGKLCF